MAGRDNLSNSKRYCVSRQLGISIIRLVFGGTGGSWEGKKSLLAAVAKTRI